MEHQGFLQQRNIATDCGDEVVASNPYDYLISGDTTRYRWPVDPDQAGGDHFIRLSALNITAAPFTLPFSDTGVTLFQGWRYNDGRWHHAVDYAIDLKSTFQVKAAAAGKVVFAGWDNWSGNTIVISYDVGGTKDAFRTIYMHLRNGPDNECANAWSKTIPSLNASDQANYKGHLTSTGCAENPRLRKPNSVNWGTNTQTIAVTAGQQVAAGQFLAWSGDTGRGGNGNGNATPDTHLHIFFTHHDPSNNQFYFFDPYGPSGNRSAIPPKRPPLSAAFAPDTPMPGREAGRSFLRGGAGRSSRTT